MVVGRQVRILFKLGVADRNPLRVTKLLKVFQGQFFHLVGGIASFEMLAQRVAFDGLGQDHRRLSLVVDGGAVGGVNLAVIVAAPFEVPDILVAHVLHQRLGAWVAAEEVVTHVAAVVGLIGLVIAIGCCIH
ncbi:Uncharacterised protein [Mycobacterium tuberculosis]|uniref:Transmembrane protein n=1 Tax=Mycobacterium tuberculosis TaxID=1773 RepID=A0A654ZRD6_MYCTX|nr:Uncharacterised protein [Mycobacterium tuberculosis]CFE39193.1 Uncharacterised protein [Mycobacterium tuberculosis]CFR68796.1 Uncharacterised protein [Mycobacterium tuberculosis]CFR76896.1 Uncharacterised protein [Mycobacterium tuberculosis]CFR80784.1 Uncharacterised protein [Mycobacterium tuberculosis]